MVVGARFAVLNQCPPATFGLASPPLVPPDVGFLRLRWASPASAHRGYAPVDCHLEPL
jgi:hypothetical protein